MVFSKHPPLNSAIKISLAYAGFSSLWIFCSSSVLGFLITDISLLTRLTIYKGFVFVIATTVLLMLFIRREMTRREVVMKALENSEKQYRVLFDSNPNPIWVYDINTLKFLAVNKPAVQHYGYSMQEFMGIRITEMHPPDLMLSMMSMVYDKTQESSEVCYAGTWKLICKDGSIITAEINTHNITFNGRGARLVLAVDVTERKRVEEEKENIARALEQNKKELETLIYTTSHDLRSPLVNIQGFSSLLAKACADIIEADNASGTGVNRQRREQILESVGYINSSVAKIDGLLNGLLKLSRAGRDEIKPVHIDIRNIINEIISAMSFQLQQVDAEVTVGSLPACKGDSVHINQVFSNLIDNAIKYRDNGRPLVIRINGLTDSHTAVYCVEDNGIGIPEDRQNTIWEMFGRLNETEVGGDGMGLTLVRKLVDRSGGRVWVTSEPGVGSRFYVSLPLTN
ncbi:MAG TPA: PAS domain-containing sensor histidine kinase [Nitrospirota bacterium]|jgi:PAS domain S-box-containing protein